MPVRMKKELRVPVLELRKLQPKSGGALFTLSLSLAATQTFGQKSHSGPQLNPLRSRHHHFACKVGNKSRRLWPPPAVGRGENEIFNDSGVGLDAHRKKRIRTHAGAFLRAINAAVTEI